MKFYDYTVDTKNQESTTLYNLNSFVASYEQVHTHTKVNIDDYMNNPETKRMFLMLMNNNVITNDSSDSDMYVPKLIFYHFAMWVDPNICVNMLKILSSSPIAHTYCTDKDIVSYKQKNKELRKRYKKCKAEVCSITQIIENLKKQKKSVEEEKDDINKELDTINEKLDLAKKELDITKLKTDQLNEYNNIVIRDYNTTQKEVDMLRKEKGLLTMYR